MVGLWLALDMYDFALRLLDEVNGGLYRMPSVEEMHSLLTHRITTFGSQKWDAEQNMQDMSGILSAQAWARLPLNNFQFSSIFWRTTQRCIDHYYYGKQGYTC
jgi:hypothetical protein